MSLQTLLQVREAPAGLPNAFHPQHGALCPAAQPGRSPELSGGPHRLVHAGLTLTLLPAPALGVDGAERPGPRRLPAGRRSHPLHAGRVSVLAVSNNTLVLLAVTGP